MFPGQTNRPLNPSAKTNRMGKLLAEAQKLAGLGAWELDMDSQQITWSVETYQLFGLDPATESPGFAQFLESIHPEDKTLFQQSVEKLLQEGLPFSVDIRLLQPDGTGRYVQAKTQVIRRRSKIVRLIGTLLDIQDRKQLELSLLRAKEEAEALTRSKSEFLSSMSHEIRTPMNAIIGLTDMLLQEDLKPQIIDNIQMIKYSSDNLLVLINDILDLSKIEAGKVTFEQVEFDLHPLLSDFSKTNSFKAKEKGLGFDFHLEPNVPRVLIGDPYRLNQILLNLTSNAIKFTLQGYIHLRVAPIQQQDGVATLLFTVQDTGIGMSEAELSKIFERFVQASLNTTRQYGGTGLGLTITKKLVDLQGGKISVSSKAGEGSTFSVELSFKASEKIALAETIHTHKAEKDLSGVKILMVEDNVMNQIVGKRLLNRWKAEIDIANDGKEALELLHQHRYHLILMDIHLPKMNGYEITKLIRDGQSGISNRDIPIIALTADAFPEMKAKTLSAGMNDWVIKPFDQNSFFDSIVRNLPDSTLSTE